MPYSMKPQTTPQNIEQSDTTQMAWPFWRGLALFEFFMAVAITISWSAEPIQIWRDQYRQAVMAAISAPSLPEKLTAFLPLTAWLGLTFV